MISAFPESVYNGLEDQWNSQLTEGLKSYLSQTETCKTCAVKDQTKQSLTVHTQLPHK